MEIWKDVVDYEGLYQVSNFGRVKRVAGSKPEQLHDNYLSPQKIKKGYLRVLLTKNNKGKHKLIHILVAEAFLGKASFDKAQVNHLNGIKDDNRPENLEWCTQSENQKHSFYVLNNNPCKRSLTEENVIKILEEFKTEKTYQEIANLFNVKKHVIVDIARNRSYKRVQRELHKRG